MGTDSFAEDCIRKIQIKSGCGQCEYTCRVESGDIVEAEAVESFKSHQIKLEDARSGLEQCYFSSEKGPLNFDQHLMKGYVFEGSDGIWNFVLESNVDCIIEYPRELKDTATKKSGIFSQAFINKIAPEKSVCDIEEKSLSQKPEIKPGTSHTYGQITKCPSSGNWIL